MIKKLYLLPLLLVVLSFAACNETEEPSQFDNWQARNEAFIDSLQQVVDAKTDSELKYLVYARDKKYKIFYKKIAEDLTGKQPVFTSTVSCYYRGMYINEAVFAANPTEKYYTRLYEDLTVFDSNTMKHGADPTNLDSPASFGVQAFYSGAAGNVPAWADILQNMRVGERWEVYIPWQIAYGSAGYESVPGYSTLMFDIILYRIDEYYR